MTFTDLDDCFHSAVEILHKDRQAKYPTSRVHKLIEAIPNKSCTEKDLKKLYTSLAIEAFHYTAESGSEYAIIWFLNCTCKMFYYITDKNFHWMLLLHCGFFFYNLTLDLKGRYAVMYKSQSELLDAVGEYKNQVEHFELVHADSLSNEGEILRILRIVILSALRSNTWDRSDTELKAPLVGDAISSSWEILPDVLRALYLYEEGLIASSSCSWSEAKKRFFQSFRILEEHFGEESVEAIYCYNSLHGEFYNLYNDVVAA